jgi:excinuclease ABC subunit A
MPPSTLTAEAPFAAGAATGHLRIRGCRVHNLKNINLDLPQEKLVVITGPSGSGKSSLAFDTIFAEGQRQYLETLSVYARQFVQQLERADVDLVENLSPTIAIDQLAPAPNPRSTVATVTEIYDYLRLLYARLGEPFCHHCGTAISQQSPEEIVEILSNLPAGTKAILLSPLVRGRKGAHADVIESIRKAGFVRARVDGEVYDIEQLPELSSKKAHDIDAVVDRIVVRDGVEARIADSLNLALKQSDGAVIALWLLPGADGTTSENWQERLFSTLYACPVCKSSFLELEPRSFSFNSPYGACPTCSGLGVIVESEGKDSATAENGDVQICDECGGSRLRPESRSVRIGGKAIHEATAFAIRDAIEFFQSLLACFSKDDRAIAEPILREICSRLRFLDRVGVGYLSLDRTADSLSGGEMQRVRLASAIGSGLVGTCYVLDEPSIGLHPRDNARLIEALRDLQQQGNTVLVVEHDEAMMRAADHLIDLGPGAGVHGGQIVAEGTPAEICGNPDSITGRYLTGKLSIKPSAARRQPAKNRELLLCGATLHNLKHIDVRIPLGLFVCVTGVSGSGKSSLINETLSPAIARKLGLVAPKPGPYSNLRGVSQIDKLVTIDQSSIGRSPRSNPATYTGLFDEIRKVFAGTREARQLGYKSNRFSFNAKGGRCEECQGQGVKRIEMNFLPDLTITCPVCGGARFNEQTLRVKYKDQSIAEVLKMSIDEAAMFFENFSQMTRSLACLRQVGLGYLTLGQASTTLSGGEAQRIKLATELARSTTGNTLYILDEPTTGLHFDDIRNLLGVLNSLVDLGNTVLVIEHNLDVIRSADWLIDLGPEGGNGGGQLLATGPPEEVAACLSSATGQVLAQAIAHSS